MSSPSIRLPRDIIDALAAKRAFPLLIEHREPTVPGLSLTAIANIDLSITFLVIAPDEGATDEWITIPVEPFLLEPIFPIESECDDATIVHVLWSEWHSGGMKNAIDVFKNLKQVVRRHAMHQMLSLERKRSNQEDDEQNKEPVNRRRTSKKRRSNEKGGKT